MMKKISKVMLMLMIVFSFTIMINEKVDATTYSDCYYNYKTHQKICTYKYTDKDTKKDWKSKKIWTFTNNRFNRLKSVAKYDRYDNLKMKQYARINYNYKTKKKTAFGVKKYYSNGKLKSYDYKKYNKKGQLKSNKYGTARRYLKNYYDNGKIKQYRKYKYNAKGKAKRYYNKLYTHNKPKPTPPKKYTQSDLDKMSKEIVSLVNQRRKALGRNELVINDKLTKGALIRAKEQKYCAGHTRPVNNKCDEWGESYSSIAYEIDYTWESITGENALMRGGNTFTPSAQVFYQQWYNSIGHREQFEKAEHTEIGVAIWQDSNTGHFYAIQLFGNQN